MHSATNCPDDFTEKELSPAEIEAAELERNAEFAAAVARWCLPDSPPSLQTVTVSASPVKESPAEHQSPWFELLNGSPSCWRFTPVGDAKVPIDPRTGENFTGWTHTPYKLHQICSMNGVVKAVGLMTGKVSETMAIDFDGVGSDQTFELRTGHKVSDLPDSISWTSQREGRHQVAYRVPMSFWQRLSNKKVLKPEGGGTEGQVELRWNGHQSVVVGHHPKTDGYVFMPGRSPSEQELATAPEWLLELMLAPVIKKDETPTSSPTPFTDVERTRQFLKKEFVPAERFSDYETWLAIGMAVHDVSRETGKPDLLLPDWIAWCEAMPNFDEPECLKEWHGWTAKGVTEPRLTFRSLVDRVKKLGGDILHDSDWNPHRDARPGGFIDRARKFTAENRDRLAKLCKAHNKGIRDREETRKSAKAARIAGRKFLPLDRRMDLIERYISKLVVSVRNSLRRTAKLREAHSALDLKTALKPVDLSRLVMEAQDERSGNCYATLTADDRAAMPTPTVEWLLPSVVPANDLTIIGGRPKVGKSRLGLYLTRVLLKGDDFMGFGQPTKSHKVILVTDDQSDGDSADMLKNLGIYDHQNLLWSRRFRITAKQVDRLLADIEAHPGAVVVIDSLRSISRSSGISENDSELGVLLYDLKQSVLDAGGSLLLIHHGNKSNDQVGVEALSGHNSIPSAANTVMTIHYLPEAESNRLQKDIPERRLVREARSGPGFDLVVTMRGSGEFSKLDTFQNFQQQLEENQHEDLRMKYLSGCSRQMKKVLTLFTESTKAMSPLEIVHGAGLCRKSVKVKRDLNSSEESTYRSVIRGLKTCVDLGFLMQMQDAESFSGKAIVYGPCITAFPLVEEGLATNSN